MGDDLESIKINSDTATKGIVATAYRLTSLGIERAKAGKKEVWLTDDVGYRGEGRLALRISVSGTKRFYFRYYINGKATVIPMAPFTSVPMEGRQTLEQARQVARRYSSLHRSEKTKDVVAHLRQLGVGCGPHPSEHPVVTPSTQLEKANPMNESSVHDHAAITLDLLSQALQAHRLASEARDRLTVVLTQAIRAVMPKDSLINIERSRDTPAWLQQVKCMRGNDRGATRYRIATDPVVDVNVTHPGLSSWGCDAVPISSKTGRDMSGAAHGADASRPTVRLKGQLLSDYLLMNLDEEERLADFVAKAMTGAYAASSITAGDDPSSAAVRPARARP